MSQSQWSWLGIALVLLAAGIAPFLIEPRSEAQQIFLHVVGSGLLILAFCIWLFGCVRNAEKRTGKRWSSGKPGDYVSFEQAAADLHLRTENIHQLARECVIRGVRHGGKAKLTKREYSFLRSIIIPGDPPKFRRGKRRPMSARKQVALAGLALWALALIVYVVGGSKADEKIARLRGRSMVEVTHGSEGVEELIVGKNIATGVLAVIGLGVLTAAWCMRSEE